MRGWLGEDECGVEEGGEYIGVGGRMEREGRLG